MHNVEFNYQIFSSILYYATVFTAKIDILNSVGGGFPTLSKIVNTHAVILGLSAS